MRIQYPTDDNSFDDFDANEMIAQHEYFSLQDGQSLLVFGYTGEEEKDSASPFSNTVKKIRQHLLELEKEPQFQGVKMELTGEPTLDADRIDASTNDAMHALIITLVLIICLFVLSYRAFFRPTVTFLVLIMGVLWSLGFALVFVGHFNILSIAVIPMVLGIGIDFGIQILGRYEEELGHGRTVVEAISSSLQHTGVAIITGGSTTAAAFFSLCFNDFSGLGELGIIAGSSMIFCITANLVVLPSIFMLRDRNRTIEALKTQSSNSAWHFIHSWDRDMVRMPWLWLGIAAVISIISIISLPRLKFDYNLLHLENQQGLAVRALYDVMDASKNDHGEEVSTIYASVLTNTIDEARDLNKKLTALPVVSKVESILELVPENQDAKLPLVQRIVKAAAELNVKPASGTPVDIPRARKDVASLLSQAQEGLKEAKGYENVSKIAKQAVAAFAAIIPALERADKALNSGSVEEIQKRFSASSNGEFSRMQKNIELLKSQKGDRGLTLADVPPQLQKQFPRTEWQNPAPGLRQKGPLDTRAGRGIRQGGDAGRTEGHRHAGLELLLHRVAAGELSLGRRLGLPHHRGPHLPPFPKHQVPDADPRPAHPGRALAHRRDGLVRHRIQSRQYRHAAADHRHRCRLRGLHHRPLSRGW